MLQNFGYRTLGRYLCLNCRTTPTSANTQCECARDCNFEATCSQKCHTLEKNHFKAWLMDNYADQTQFLINFVASRCHPIIMRYELSYCIDLITNYIYDKYRFTIIYTNVPIENNYIQGNAFHIHSHQSTIINTNNEASSDNNSDSMPSLIDEESDYSSDYDDLPELIDPLENTVNLDEFVHIMSQRFLIKYNITSILEEFKDDTITNCCICFEDKSKDVFIKLGCEHEFCKECFIKTLKSKRRTKYCCCYCRTEIKTIVSRKEEIHGEIENLNI